MLDRYHFTRLSGVLESDVRSAAGDVIASIDDLVIDRDSGRVHFISVTADASLGLGDDRYAIPYDRFRFSVEEAAFVLPISDSEIEAYDDSPPDGWRLLAGDSDSTELRSLEQMTESMQTAIASSVLLDSEVFTGGEQTGEIDDAILEIQTGSVGLLQLDDDEGLFFGMGQGSACVPWSAAAIATGRIELKIDPADLGGCEPVPDLDKVWSLPVAFSPAKPAVVVETYVFPPRDAPGDTTPTNSVPVNGFPTWHNEPDDND
ncbi:MAG: PRC-barrel domain-containing protein [Planctomycetota bacterium]